MTDSARENGARERGDAALWQRLLARWCSAIEAGRLTLIYPDGAREVFASPRPGPDATVRIRRGRLVWRMLTGGDIGLAESYMDGDWTTPDLTAVIELGVVNADALERTLAVSRPLTVINRLRHRRRANTRRGSRRNIAYHYDLGNEFYRRWLDETMTYSSALFERPDMDLSQAQTEKYRRIARALDLKPGHRVLEIGCGWGGFAEIAARDFGCHVVGLTLSQEQAAFARQRMARLGLAERVEIRIQDYRDTPETFDRIASIEMFEAVGEENWPVYFRVLRDRLVAGGRAALQIITISDERFDAYRRGVDFIQRYIFPGGMLPSPSALRQVIQTAGLRLEDGYYFGKSYAETLRRWNEAFLARWPEIAPLGFDERFRGMWSYYLCYCQAGFRAGQIDVGQFVIARP